MSPRPVAVIWTGAAVGDLERIAAYLLEESPLRARRIVERLAARAESLSCSPERGRTPPELRAIGDRTWREVVESPWRIIYRLVEEQATVEIHGVLDGRRSLQELLMERLLHS